ncbi:hypothetical protein L3X38_012423 [Prunus dulcis]|uniref:Retrotransposon gag domain-containing protein n=1 Tax=Prunus dulcis TaxID=3755 RepID=A0AAD4WK05_PRUDU|nr:hypothetical protein L3X38_012423 [Prunus dulcis]
MAAEALEKSKGNHTSHLEGPKKSKRKEMIELSDGSSTESVYFDGQHNDHEDHQDQRRELKMSKDSELRRQIEKIVKWYKSHTHAELAVEAAKEICKSPFTNDILKAKKPAKFTQPKFKLFEGVVDPIEHIYHFQQQIESEDKVLLCKLFPSSLSGSALTWFRQLKPKSISIFTELCEAFISQYVCNQRRKKDIAALFNTKQKACESLKDYLKRFTEEMSTLETYDSHTVSLTFRKGVTLGTKMHKSLVKTPPLDMREVLTRVDGIIRLEEEELALSRRTAATISTPKHSCEMIQGPWTNFPNGSLRNQVRTNSPPTKFTIKDKLKEERTAEPVTNNIVVEKGLLEINAIHGWSQPPEGQLARAPTKKRHAEKIRCVCGIASTPESAQSLEKIGIISFTQCDLEGIQFPHNDALVITLQIGNSKVKRVMIDSGSSAVVMFWNTFKIMKLDENGIRPNPTLFFAFEGSKARAIEDVTLPIIVAGKTLLVTFVVMKAPSAYNVIMGRNWINKMDGEALTRCQVMRCLIDDGLGIINIKGVQLEAKRCYNIVTDLKNTAKARPQPNQQL